MALKTGYDLVVTIVNKGWSEPVIDAAKAAGAGGATVLNGRGSGSAGALRLLGLAIEPEKEIIFSVVPEAISSKVLEAVEKAVDLRAPGTGIAMVLPLKCAVGLLGDADFSCGN